GGGGVFWDEKPVNIDDLPNRFKSMGGTKPQPEIRIRADQNTRYESLAKVIASARPSGMNRIGFVTTPPSGAPAGGAPAAAGAAPAPSAR
ncbi:ExbD/TolR family protein, partial [Achromobacter xylosoxidans]|uniref:ExbD/TolR family protein n=1 Tax=Alcaligenes xylosoxydans xylosoxydans TaxID=85698 RepID=UPI0037646273